MPIVSEAVSPAPLPHAAPAAPVIEVKLAGAAVRIVSTIDDIAELTAVLRAVRASTMLTDVEHRDCPCCGGTLHVIDETGTVYDGNRNMGAPFWAAGVSPPPP